MKRIIAALFVFSFIAVNARAQRPFTEGVIVYKVTLSAPGKGSYSGTYTFTIKGDLLRKELRLDNGFEDVVLVTARNSAYSLQTANGNKYAIQLNCDDMLKRQDKYRGFNTAGEAAGGQVAGVTAHRAKLTYRDGTGGDISYTKDWYATMPLTYERFPDARFIPLVYEFTDDKGITMRLEAKEVSARPIESGTFRMPDGYKTISYQEYQQMRR